MKQITAVGIDVSKGRSMIAVRQPGGVILAAPFKVNHTATELNQLVQILCQYPGEVRIVMEHTGAYRRPIALALLNAGFFVSIVNAMLIHDFHDNSLRQVKLDKVEVLMLSILSGAALAVAPDTTEPETVLQLPVSDEIYCSLLTFEYSYSAILHSDTYGSIPVYPFYDGPTYHGALYSAATNVNDAQEGQISSPGISVRLLSQAATHQKYMRCWILVNQDRYRIITSMAESKLRSLSIVASFFAAVKHSLAFILSEYSNVVPKR